MSKFMCDHCGIEVGRKDNLIRHISKQHLSSVKDRSKSCKMPCLSCTSVFPNRSKFLNHLTTVHGIQITTENFSFGSVSEFVTWKNNIEKENSCRYVQNCGIRKWKNKISKYFYCHRDGFVRLRAPKPRKRLLKRQGSNKIGHACTSRIFYQELASGTINVEFVSTHYGHDDNTGRLSLTKEEKAQIAGKIKAGIVFDTVLDDIYDSVNDVNSSIPLADKQDLRNIIRDFDLNPWKGHVNDTISVDLWNNKVSAVEDINMNPVVFYKRQGEKFMDDRLDTNDIMLITSNQFQRTMLKQFGDNIVYTDITHGLNQYDFHLSTLVVVDECSAGIPVAFCLSNKRNADAFSVFYEKMKLVVGTVSPKVFMSDDDPALYNAWKDIMGPVPNRLLCTWHVDKSWRENIRSKIPHKEKRVLVYKRLRALLQEVNLDSFHVLMDSFLQQTLSDPDTKSFGEYFATYYEKRASCWAYTYRKNCDINTNMRLEAIHKIVKYFYLNGKKNKRLDRCIDALTKYTRDCLLRRIKKKSKQQRPAQIKNILLSHQEAVNNKWAAHVTPHEITFNVWYVRSFANAEIKYTVEMILDDVKVCNNNCFLICEECALKICIHTFSCECVDHLIKNNICKHIHAVVLFLTNRAEQCNPNVLQLNICETEVFTLQPFVDTFTYQNEDHFHHDLHYKEFRTKTETILGYLENSNLPSITNDEILRVNQAYDVILDFFHSKYQGCELNATSKDSSIKKIEKQRRFESTKKKVNKAVSLCEPTSAEQHFFLKEGLKCNVDEIHNIHIKFDHLYTNAIEDVV